MSIHGWYCNLVIMERYQYIYLQIVTVHNRIGGKNQYHWTFIFIGNMESIIVKKWRTVSFSSLWLIYNREFVFNTINIDPANRVYAAVTDYYQLLSVSDPANYEHPLIWASNNNRLFCEVKVFTEIATITWDLIKQLYYFNISHL